MATEDLEHEKNPYSTWENRRSDVLLPPSTLERYYKLLRSINILLICVFLISFSALIFIVARFIFFQDYEVFLFVDGTELSCILNPKTGEISQNE